MARADLAGPVADAAVADLLSLRSEIVRALNRALLALDTETGADALVRRQSRTQADVLRQIDDVLTRQGVDAARLVLGQRAAEAVSAVAGPLPVPADATREIRQILEGRTQEIAAALGDAHDEIRRAVNAGVAGGASLAELVEVVGQRVGVATTRAQAAVDAGVMAAGRVATLRMAQAVLEDADEPVALAYIYSGPSDAKNRPFCARLVGKALTERALAVLDNGHGLPVDAFCGGYNCRHVLSPVTLPEALRRGLEIVDG